MIIQLRVFLIYFRPIRDRARSDLFKIQVLIPNIDAQCAHGYYKRKSNHTCRNEIGMKKIDTDHSRQPGRKNSPIHPLLRCVRIFPRTNAAPAMTADDSLFLPFIKIPQTLT